MSSAPFILFKTLSVQATALLGHELGCVLSGCNPENNPQSPKVIVISLMGASWSGKTPFYAATAQEILKDNSSDWQGFDHERKSGNVIMRHIDLALENDVSDTDNISFLDSSGSKTKKTESEIKVHTNSPTPGTEWRIYFIEHPSIKLMELSDFLFVASNLGDASQSDAKNRDTVADSLAYLTNATDLLKKTVKELESASDNKTHPNIKVALTQIGAVKQLTLQHKNEYIFRPGLNKPYRPGHLISLGLLNSKPPREVDNCLYQSFESFKRRANKIIYAR